MSACVVQPISVVYRLLDGIPLGRFYRPFFAWYGDMAMPPHLWKMLGLGQLTVVMTFHAPVRLEDFGARKALSEHCAGVIAEGVARGPRRARCGGRRRAAAPAALAAQ